MEGRDLLTNALMRVQVSIHAVLNGLTPGQLVFRPNVSSNTIAWLIWHLTRVQDHHISDLVGLPQKWVDQGFSTKFNMKPDPLNTGTGHTPEEVAMIQPPSSEILREYFDAVFGRTKEYLHSLTAADLDVELDERQYNPLPTVGIRLISVVNDNTQHVGQAAYLRGLLLAEGCK